MSRHQPKNAFTTLQGVWDLDAEGSPTVGELARVASIELNIDEFLYLTDALNIFQLKGRTRDSLLAKLKEAHAALRAVALLSEPEPEPTTYPVTTRGHLIEVLHRVAERSDLVTRDVLREAGLGPETLRRIAKLLDDGAPRVGVVTPPSWDEER